MIQVHPQLEEGVTIHGVLPNQQMSSYNESRYVHPCSSDARSFWPSGADD